MIYFSKSPSDWHKLIIIGLNINSLIFSFNINGKRQIQEPAQNHPHQPYENRNRYFHFVAAFRGAEVVEHHQHAELKTDQFHGSLLTVPAHKVPMYY